MDGLSINGSMLSGTGGRAALDSGTTCARSYSFGPGTRSYSLTRASFSSPLSLSRLIQVPTSTAEAFYSQIPGARLSALGDGSYVVPCSTSFTSLALSFGGIQYEIPPKDLLRAVSRDGSQCVLTILAQDLQDVDGVPMAIVGEVFLKNAYSIYSYSNNGAPAVGLAKSIIAGTWANNGTDSSQSRPGGSRFSQPVNQGSLSYSGAPLPTVSSVTAASRTRTGTTTGRAIITTAGLGGTGAVTGPWTASTARGSSGSGASAGGSTSAADGRGSAVSLGAVVLSSGLALFATVLAASAAVW